MRLSASVSSSDFGDERRGTAGSLELENGLTRGLDSHRAEGVL